MINGFVVLEALHGVDRFVARRALLQLDGCPHALAPADLWRGKEEEEDVEMGVAFVNTSNELVRVREQTGHSELAGFKEIRKRERE